MSRSISSNPSNSGLDSRETRDMAQALLIAALTAPPADWAAPRRRPRFRAPAVPNTNMGTGSAKSRNEPGTPGPGVGPICLAGQGLAAGRQAAPAQPGLVSALDHDVSAQASTQRLHATW